MTAPSELVWETHVHLQQGPVARSEHRRGKALEAHMWVPAPSVRCDRASEHHLCLAGGVATGSAPAGTISATMSNRDGRSTPVQLTWGSAEGRRSLSRKAQLACIAGWPPSYSLHSVSL